MSNYQKRIVKAMHKDVYAAPSGWEALEHFVDVWADKFERALWAAAAHESIDAGVEELEKA